MMDEPADRHWFKKYGAPGDKKRKAIAQKMTAAQHLKKHGNLWGHKHKRDAQAEGESRSDFERGN